MSRVNARPHLHYACCYLRRLAAVRKSLHPFAQPPTMYERWTGCHQRHLASPNTARDLHAAHVHTALGGDGTSHSASDSHHVCSSMDKRLQNCALCRCNGLNSTTGVTFITGATVRMCCTPYPPSLHHACRKLPTAWPYNAVLVYAPHMMMAHMTVRGGLIIVRVNQAITT